jgi:hypothetical protein
MKLLMPIALLCALTAQAQRGGMGGMGGGGARGGVGTPPMGAGGRGGVGMPGAPGIGHRPGIPVAPMGGHAFRGGAPYYGFGAYGLGLGWGWGVGSYGCPYSYPCSNYVTYPYVGGYWPGYSDVAPIQYGPAYSQPPVTVVYPPQQVQVERARPVTHEYDEFGREVQPAASANASPIYLFAFEDHTIQAASSYRIEGATLHFTTLQNEQKKAATDSLDRDLTMQLNRERGVVVRLP